MLSSFIQFFEKRKLLHPKPDFLVAVSGGIDSAVLCELCHQAAFDFTIIHCNFHLRGDESMRDEAFVESLGAKYKVPVIIKHFNTQSFAMENSLSIQEAARDLRYQWFAEIKAERKASCTLLAHHANDNIETVVMNFFRGTGLDGLSGMPEEVIKSDCLRPLLKFTRKEIEEFAYTHQIDWVEDSSNVSNKYTRNFFRNEVIPAIQNVYPQVEENIGNNIDRFKKTANLYHQLVSELKEKLNKGIPPESRYPAKQLLAYRHTALIFEIIKGFGFGERQVEAVEKLCSGETGKYIENEFFQIIKHRAWLVIAPKRESANTIAIEKEEKEIRFEGGFIEIKKSKKDKGRLQKAPQVAQVDGSKIVFPLLVRRWQTGDYFYPLGMPKKKKLSRFFIDQKLSKIDKEKVWVMESGKRIVWVMGYRIDDRFKITDQTKEVLEITITNP